MMGFGEPDRIACSRAGCSESATWKVEWRNPRIHAADRVKVWLACDDHQEYLRDYLATRDFPVSVVPLDTSKDMDDSLPLDPILTVDPIPESSPEGTKDI